MILEVRCCCRPEKLLGWLPVSDDVDVKEGVAVTFIIRPAHVRLLDSAVFGPLDGPLGVEHVPAEGVTLAIATYSAAPSGEWEYRLAFKSEDTPLETLRRIPGFHEHIGR